MGRTRRSTIAGSAGARWAFRPDDGRTGGRRCRAQDRDDRRDLFEGAPHGIEPVGKKGISGG